MDNPMTKQRVEQYAKLQREIASIEGQLYSWETNSEEYLSDVVQGSTPGNVNKHNIVIQGYGSRRIPKLRARLMSCPVKV